MTSLGSNSKVSVESHALVKKAVKTILNKKTKHKTLREEQSFKDMKFKENISIVENSEGSVSYICKVCQTKFNFSRKARSHASKCRTRKKQKKKTSPCET